MASALSRSLRSPRVLIALGMIFCFAFCAVFAGWIAPHDPGDQNLLAILQPPAWVDGGDLNYPLGTDSLGRCVLSRLIYGARTAMLVALFASLGAMIIGTILAHISGYFGGAVDWLIGRLVDVWMSFPPVILSLILMVGLGVGLSKVILAIVLVDWTRFCRVLRSEVLIVTRHDYVAAARLLGFTHWQTIVREVLPATTPLLITLISLEMAIAVVVEAILSFIGLGVGANTPAWGQMIADARQYVYQSPWNSAAADLCDFPHRHRIQSPGRRAAPHARRAACGNRALTMLALQAKDLVVERPHRRRHGAGDPRAVVRPAGGKNPRARGRVRRRQIHGRPRHRATSAGRFRDHVRVAAVRRRRPRAHGAGRAARAARPRHRLHPAGADDLAQSGAHHRRAIRRAFGAARRRQPQRAPRPRGRHADGGKTAARRGAADAISASIVRRHVPARADRLGVFERSAPGHRRRADHRARCHDASADPEADRRHAARARHRGHLHHPRPAACRATVRPGHRDVCRPRRRERAGARRAVDAGASLYALPAARQSVDARGAARALRHAGPDAELAPAQKPVRLPFRAALSSCHRRVPPRRAAEHCRRRRSSCRVHSRRGDADDRDDGRR